MASPQTKTVPDEDAPFDSSRALWLGGPTQAALRETLGLTRSFWPRGNVPRRWRRRIVRELEQCLFAERPLVVSRYPPFSYVTLDDRALYLWAGNRPGEPQPWHPAEGPPFDAWVDWGRDVPASLAWWEEQQAARKAQWVR